MKAWLTMFSYQPLFRWHLEDRQAGEDLFGFDFVLYKAGKHTSSTER